jgi:hypothetical protein
MEAYTLWWNGGSFRSFMRINSKVSLAEDYENILNHPAHTMQELEMIKAYRTKATKLAMSLIITMARVHKSKILYNDISPSNCCNISSKVLFNIHLDGLRYTFELPTVIQLTTPYELSRLSLARPVSIYSGPLALCYDLS